MKNHSEIGWVLREYNNLAESALTLGIKSPESHYIDGKIEGKKNKDKGNDNKIIGKSIETLNRKSFAETFDSSEDVQPNRKPCLTKIPGLVKRPKSLKVPGFLKGFKPVRIFQSKQ